MSAPLISLKNYRVYRQNKLALEIDSLELSEGERVAIIGPNGSGKTTLLLALGKIIPGKGEFRYNNISINKRSELLSFRRNLALVFQKSYLLNTSVTRNIASGLRFRHADKLNRERLISEYLEKMGIAHLAKRNSRSLSGGEAQRVNLARALVLEPALFLMDEPFSALDPQGGKALLHDLSIALRNSKTTLVIATHSRDEALALADRILVMENGHIIQDGDPENILNSPKNEFTASFGGMESILRARVLQSTPNGILVSCHNQNIEIASQGEPDEEIIIGIRPENVVISREVQSGSSIRNSFMASVSTILPQGLFYRIGLDCGFPLIAYITAQSLNDLGLVTGSKVRASFKATAVHILKEN